MPDRPDNRSEYDDGRQHGSADPNYRPEFQGDSFDGLRPTEEMNDEYDDD